jgi:hypothetical protein
VGHGAVRAVNYSTLTFRHKRAVRKGVDRSHEHLPEGGCDD